MIALLEGEISDKLDGSVVLMVHGVGYDLRVCSEDYGSLKADAMAKLYVYEHIRENSYDLYGFRSKPTKALFELLLDVNGVGPKMALGILDVGTVDEVRLAIAEGNVKFIQAASGVGKKVAERAVVDLKDKVGLASSDSATTFLQSALVGAHDEALQGLLALGFSAPDANEALAGIDPGLPAEQRITLALKARH